MTPSRWLALSIVTLCALVPKLAQAQINTPSSAPISVCGNGISEPGEECDDGNNQMGDGCSAFCYPEGNAPQQAEGERLFKIWQRHQNEPLGYTPTSLKDPQIARKKALNYTIAAYVLSIYPLFWVVTVPALIVTPSLGYKYLGDKQQARRMMGRRLLARAVTVSGVLIAALAAEADNDAAFVAGEALATGVVVTGLVMNFIYTSGDIYYTKKATARHNKIVESGGVELSPQSTPPTEVSPIYTPSITPSTAPTTLPKGPPRP